MLDSIYALFLPESRDRTVFAVQECIANGTPFDVEVQMVTATGRPVWVRSIGQAVREADGQVVRIQGAQQDITQHVRLVAEVQELNFGLEEKIAARTAELTANEAALRLANQQLESFSYSVSHDLQSPLQRVAAFAKLLDHELRSAPESKAGHYLARIQANVEQMTQLIDGLLALAHVSQIELIRGSVNLSALASEVLESLRSGDSTRDLHWHVEPGLSANADVRLMRSVMENLLGNAWKFTSHRPEAQITFGATEKADEYFVRDNGAGFDMAYAGKLFGTFQRLHGLDEFPGTGIGLATVARAVGRHGGRVRAEAAAGQGATFYFTIPPVPAPA
ncbi:MAG: ATP-binding protein [Ramlibacter sp.]